MINTIIFDFGDIFINLDIEAPRIAFSKLGLQAWSEDLDKLNSSFEKGKISELQFLEGFQEKMPKASIKKIKSAWNTVLLDFPLYRLEFLQMLSQKYRLFLLSNTDAIHIDRFQHVAGTTFYREFYECFERVYFSFELGMRKPEANIFNYLIKQHELIPKRTLFIDDKTENTDAALALGFQVWNLQVGKEDVVQLFDKKII
nr:HAD family phosphatase [Flavobacterium sp.]